MQETCEMLLPQDIKRAVNVGRRRIPLENEQVKQLRMFGDASLRYGIQNVNCFTKRLLE